MYHYLAGFMGDGGKVAPALFLDHGKIPPVTVPADLVDQMDPKAQMEQGVSFLAQQKHQKELGKSLSEPLNADAARARRPRQTLARPVTEGGDHTRNIYAEARRAKNRTCIQTQPPSRHFTRLTVAAPTNMPHLWNRHALPIAMRKSTRVTAHVSTL